MYVEGAGLVEFLLLLFFFQQEQEFFFNFLRKTKGSGTGIPVEFLSVARTPKGQVRPTES
jgi:hypothetical protein